MHNNRSPWPQTINDAAERIIAIMNDKEKTKVRAVPEGKLQKLRFILGMPIRNELGLFEGNDALLKACAISKYGDFEALFFFNDVDSAYDVIVEAIWRKLEKAEYDNDRLSCQVTHLSFELSIQEKTTDS